MTGRGWIGWGLAGVTSLGLHGMVAAMTQSATPEPVMDGSAVAGEVALGSSFADLVQGRDEPVKPQPAQRAEPVRAAQVGPMTPPETVKTPATAAKPPLQAMATTPLVAAVTQARTVTAVKPIEPVPETAKAAPPPMPKTLTARDEPPKKAPSKKPAPKPATKGNAKVTSKSGTSEGKTSGTLAEKSSDKAKRNAKQAGDGAVRSYQRSVLRKIARVPKRRAGGRGKAQVGMVIAPGGSIASLRVVRSSGDGAIDRMALDTVRRAGPFGPTPDSRQIKLLVELKSEG